jgi:hypothetical protein
MYRTLIAAMLDSVKSADRKNRKKVQTTLASHKFTFLVLSFLVTILTSDEQRTRLYMNYKWRERVNKPS